jgi:ribosome modulation factor
MSLSKKPETSRGERFKAFRDGASAYRNGKSVGASPYMGEGPVLEALRQRWVLGYRYARRERAVANAAV